MKRLLSIIICILFSFILTSTVGAETLEELEEKKEKLQQSIEEGKNQIKEMEEQLQIYYARIQELNSQILEAIGVIDDYNAQLDEKKLQIDKTQEELAIARENEVVYSNQVDERIKVMYEFGEADYLDILIESSNLGDFFTRLEYLQKILEYDEKMILELEEIRNEIEAKEAQLQVEEAALEHLKAEANLKKQQLDELVVQVALEKEKVETDKELVTAQIEKMEKEDEELDDLIKKKLAESKLVFTDGEFKWPLPGYYYISSGFVNRIHPIFGYKESHKGIDIPAPYGTPVLAAANGVVIRSNTSASYGNVVVIDHGSGYATLYAHNSKLLVSEGDVVVKGQEISLVGSTGWSTGNHLHFGVQINGQWVDPLNYFNNN